MQELPGIPASNDAATRDSCLELTVAMGPRHGQSGTADGATRLIVGRGPDCQLQVVDRRMSREHFLAECSEGSWKVHDLASRNGTFVNDQRIDRVTEVCDGDLLLAGDTVFQVRISQAKQGRVDPKHTPATKETSRIAMARTSKVQASDRVRSRPD